MGVCFNPRSRGSVGRPGPEVGGRRDEVQVGRVLRVSSRSSKADGTGNSGLRTEHLPPLSAQTREGIISPSLKQPLRLFLIKKTLIYLMFLV